MTAIFKKELRSYFLSPIGYVFVAVFVFISSIFFVRFNLFGGLGDIQYVFSNLSLVFVLIIPILTMKSIAEEKNTKTDQLLLTAPIYIHSIVIGKLFAASIVYLCALMITFLYPLIMSIFTDLAWGEVIGNYIGFFLMGTSFISVGIFISSLTENQIISAVCTFGILLALYLIEMFSPLISNAFIATVVEAVSVNKRYYDFTTGIINVESVIYYLSIVAIFSFLTIRHLEKRRWSK